MAHLTPSRRMVLSLLGSAALAPLLSAAPVQAKDPAVTALILSDLHSAYERTGQLLAEIERQVLAASGPVLILVNGDLFESGNVVAMRSDGVIDWAFLEALNDLAPTVFNIGNHEPDIDNDLAQFVSRAQALGVTVLSNITDTRTGALYASAQADLDLNGTPVAISALAVDAIFTYPKASRDQLSIPDPVSWARAHLGEDLKDGAVNIVMSHAGVMPDKEILTMVPDGTLMIGGHDHLNIEHAEGNTRYVHTGSWSTTLTVARIAAPGQPAEISRVAIDLTTAPSPVLAELIKTTLATHLDAEDTASVGSSPTAMSNDQTGVFVAAAMAEAAGADIGFIGHTTFGAGLPEGPVSRYAFNASVRFDGKLVKTEVDAATLQQILTRCNQFGDFAFAERTGDYLYAAPEAPAKDRFTLVTNGWSATNQKSYFGREDLVFTEVPDLMVKAVVLNKLG